MLAHIQVPLQTWLVSNLLSQIGSHPIGVRSELLKSLTHIRAQHKKIGGKPECLFG